MFIGLLRISLPAVLATVLGTQVAHADIYTWVDASGTINVSNLAPPDGVSVTRVLRADPTPPGDPAARDAQVRALTERVSQLQDQIEMAQRQVPPPLPYPAMPPPSAYPAMPPPVVEYVNVVNVMSPPVDYEPSPPPQPAVGCDPSWFNCGFGWAPVFYPAGVVLLRPPYSPRPHPYQYQGTHRFAVQLPARATSAGLRSG